MATYHEHMNMAAMGAQARSLSPFLVESLTRWLQVAGTHSERPHGKGEVLMMIHDNDNYPENLMIYKEYI